MHMPESTQSDVPYTEAYYKHIDRTSQQSAAVIVPLICELLKPRSVIDVGCGRGFWAAAARDWGAEEIFGVDGEWVDPERLAIPADCFRHVDLERELQLDKRYDLAISLEVAEHLPPETSRTFVGSLTQAAPAVLFSAAIPGQTGDRHINERWQPFWLQLFAEKEYLPIDCVRPVVWPARRVAYWYAQNTLLYVHRSLLQEHEKLRALAAASRGPFAVVHPRLLEAYAKRLAKTLANLRSLQQENERLNTRIQQLEAER